MRRVLAAFAALATALPLLLAAPAAHAEPAPVAYDYPVDPGTPEWAAFQTHAEMLAATQIPEDVLASMSTRDLVASVLAYPMYLDRLAFNTPQQGFERMASRFNGFRELYSRPDAGAELVAAYRRLTGAEMAAGVTEARSYLHVSNLEMLLAQRQVLASFDNTLLDTLIAIASAWLEAIDEADMSTPSEEETPLLLLARALAMPLPTGGGWDAGSFLSTGLLTSEEMLADVQAFVTGRSVVPEPVRVMPPEGEPPDGDSYGTVYTPNGTPVSVIVMGWEFTRATIEDTNRDYAKRYPNATRLADASRKYNCHSYAWHYQSSSNNKWMDSPGDDKYWGDGSYLRWSTSVGPKQYKRLSWTSDDHSAIRAASSGSYWDSKWGTAPLMRHTWNYTPYTDTAVVHYYRNPG